MLPSSPQQQLPFGSLVLITPSNFPAGEITSTPPGPVAHTFPSRSTFNPSHPPFTPGFRRGSASKNTRPAPSVPFSFTAYAITRGAFPSLTATYSVCSSGENPMPFGKFSSFVNSVTTPSVATRYTPAYGSSRNGESATFVNPYGGSVK